MAAKKNTKKIQAKKIVKKTVKAVISKAKKAAKKITAKVQKAAPKKTAVKKTAVKKAAKPAAKKTVKPVKKGAAKKIVKKTVKPAAKKQVKKAVAKKDLKIKKTAVKKAAKPAVKKTVKPVKKAAPKKAVKKTVKKAAVKKVKAAKPTGFKSMPLPIYNHEDATAAAPVKLSVTEISKNEVEAIRKELEDTKALLQRRIAEKIELDMTESEVGDEIDTATQSLDKELLFEVNDNDHMQIEQIDAALRRIQLGIYGTCTSCQKPIPKKRLKALPFARYCINCQNNTETQSE